MWMRTTQHLWLVLLTCSTCAASEAGKLKLHVIDAEGHSLPCRVHLFDAEGEPQRAGDLPFWRDHFVCAGSAELQLSPGTYRYAIERGPEYVSAQGRVEVSGGGEDKLSVRLDRLSELRTQGWYSGDLHIHRSLDSIPLLMQAEDLDVGPVITWWNARNPWTDREPPSPTLRNLKPARYYDVMAGEDERGGGAVLFFHLRRPLTITDAEREYPSSLRYIDRAHAENPDVWIDIEKPFWWDVPLWLASGQADSIGIAHNHMHRSGVLASEAWGRARDPRQYPGPQGNGYWTQDIYYHALNCGIRIPPSAGSASGVLPNPVGYNRAYVHVEGTWSYAAWWRALRAGRVFVTNGPLLLARADGKLPGHVFSANAGARLTIPVKVNLTSRDDLARLEIIKNGRVSSSMPIPEDPSQSSLGEVTFSRPGWFLIRAVADNDDTFRFASTGPFYVEVGGKHQVVRESAEFFLEWAQQRRRQLEGSLEGTQRAEVLASHNKAIQFWRGKVEQR